MNQTQLNYIERALDKQWHCTEGYYIEAGQALLAHVRELQGFVGDLVAHLDSPGPSPEKTAAHYQVAARARALVRQFDIPAQSPAVMCDSR